MVYDSTKTLLRSIIQSLETADEAAWDDLHELGKACIYEMSQMSRQSYQPCRKDLANTQWPSHLPNSGKGIEALPHVKLMVGHSASRSSDRTRKRQGRSRCNVTHGGYRNRLFWAMVQFDRPMTQGRFSTDDRHEPC
jgi:hypothetical protein